MARLDVFSRVLQLVCNVFDSYSAVLFLPDQGGEGCRLAASFSLGDGVRQGMTLAPGQGLVGWIVRERKPLLVGNFDQKRGVLGYYSGKGEAEIRAFLGVPLEGVTGALCLDSKKVHSFGDKDQKILGEFARLVSALYLERDSLAEGHAEARICQCLRQLTDLPRMHPKWHAYLGELLDQVSRATGFSHCFLAVRDDPSCCFSVEGVSKVLFSPSQPAPAGFPLGGGMIGWVFKNDAPVYSQEADTTALRLFGAQASAPVFKTVICQPVRFSRRTRAVLVLASQETATLGDLHKDFARAVADQLAMFLENLHLKARLARHKA
ncbi:GAF domain-containing protein [Fundidesulfovibrio agrisoli]|uniref:GAF domain-containing protein n=1 Tax=Fundidesulfovibrio agrisoli TaxID=2922717 RepID=UPI001FAD059E|nr:GAF domain-containing protein [Fundidesulfovibrio agrisoli]